MSFSEFHRMNIITKNNFSNEDYEKIKYGYRVLYINLSKTFVLFICAVFLNILKETAVLLCAFSFVRVFGFGFHAKNTIKCTIVGIIEFIGCTYVAIRCNPLGIIDSSIIYFVCIIIFLKWAPAETDKRPINKQRKRKFKLLAIIATTVLFIGALCIGTGVYRNLIVIGILLEAINVLPLMRKIIL